MNKLIFYLIKQMLSNEIIKEKQVPIYEYGLEILISSTITSLSVLFFSIIIRSWEYGVLYLMLTIPLRIHGGGYHAPTRKACFILSNAIFILLLALNQLLTSLAIPISCWLLILFASFLSIYCNTPITNRKHPLNEKRLKNNEKAIRLFASIDLILFILLLKLFPASALLHFLILSYTSLAMLILLEKLKLQFKTAVRKEG